MTRAITREEIISMPAGRELNALVAEHIFQKKVDLNRASDKVVWNEGGLWSWLKEYSTDIAAAWEVVPKIPAFQIQQRANGRFVTRCKNYGKSGWHVESSSAPVAICKAALLSLLKED